MSLQELDSGTTRQVEELLREEALKAGLTWHTTSFESPLTRNRRIPLALAASKPMISPLYSATLFVALGPTYSISSSSCSASEKDLVKMDKKLASYTRMVD